MKKSRNNVLSGMLMLLGFLLLAATGKISVSAAVENVRVDDITIIENTNQEKVDGWYQYLYDADVHVMLTFADGSMSETDGCDEFYANGDFYTIEIEDGQSAENPWTIGTHAVEATVKRNGPEQEEWKTEFHVNVVETPVDHIEVDPITLIERADGYYTDDYDDQGKRQTWFRYDTGRVDAYRVVMKDGTVLAGKRYESVEYDGKWYRLRTESEQGINDQWEAGEHKAIAECMGVKTEFSVTVIKTPVKEFRIEDMTLIKDYDGYLTEDYWNRGKEYFRYSFYPQPTLVLEDGTKYDSRYIKYRNWSYPLDYDDDQSADSPWGIGSHEVTATMLGATTTFHVNVIENPYQAFEILDVSPVEEDDYGSDCLYFKYKVTKKDGTSFVGVYDSTGDRDDRYLKVTFRYWQGEDIFTVDYAGIEAEGKIQILPAEGLYDYIEQNGGLYITKCRDDSEELVIPDEIDGKPVVGILTLGSLSDEVSSISIPDTVTVIGASAFEGVRWGLQTLKIGKGVKALDAELLSPCRYIREVIVAEENPSYVASDGVLFDKEKKTLVFYPAGKRTSEDQPYVVPASVTEIADEYVWKHVNIEFADGSKAFVTENGVTYDKNKTRILSSDSGLSGRYEMPDTVTQIAEFAFEDCKQLVEVKVSKNVTAITYRAFQNCSSLTNVELPDNLISIGESAFAGSGLTSITIPERVQTIADAAFAQSKLDEVLIGNPNISIGRRAFADCPLTKLDTISAESLMDYTFAGSGIRKITIDKTVTSIAYQAFDSCKDLAEVHVDKDVLAISSSAFEGTKWYQNQPDGAVYLDHIFYRYKGSDPVDLSVAKGTTSIADRALTGRNKLTNLTLPDDLKRIGVLAFDGCSELRTIAIPASVTDIADYAFVNCTALSEIRVDAANPNYSSVDGVLYSKDQTELIYCPKQKSGSYTVPASVKKIKAFAFDAGCVTNVTIMGKDTEFERYAAGYNLTQADNYGNVVRTRRADVTIFCVKNSPAERYAKKWLFGVKYLEADKPEPQPTTEDKPAEENPTEQPTKDNPAEGKPTEQPTKDNPAEGKPTEQPKTEEQPKTDDSGTQPIPRLKKTNISLKAGKTAAIAVLNAGKKEITYHSSNSRVAKVEKTGKVTALKKGNADITVSVGDTKLTYKVKVTSSPKLSKKSITIKAGKTKTIKISGKAKGVHNVYSSSKVAKVTSKKTANAIKMV